MEKLAQLACYREGVNAHLTGAIATAQESPGGFLMPNQSLLYTGRVLACTQLPAMMHLTRELCGGQICVTPDSRPSCRPTRGPDEKFLQRQRDWRAEDRRKLLAFGRDLVNSTTRATRSPFSFSPSPPPFAHLAAVYRNFDFDGPMRFVKKAAGLSDNAMR